MLKKTFGENEFLQRWEYFHQGISRKMRKARNATQENPGRLLKYLSLCKLLQKTPKTPCMIRFEATFFL